MNNLESIFSHISEKYNFIGEGEDKQGNLYKFCNYSTTIQVLPSWIDIIKSKFPNFSIYHLYLNYYSIGFNKKY